MANIIGSIKECTTQKAQCGGQLTIMDESAPSGDGKLLSKLARVKSKRKLDSTRRTFMDKVPYVIADIKYMGSVRCVTRLYRNMPRNREVTSIVLEVKRQGAWYPVNNDGVCSDFPSVMSL